MTAPPNAYAIAAELADVIQRDPEVAALLSPRNKSVKVNAFANENPSLTPCVGVYLRSATVDPSTIPHGWRTTLRLAVTTQASGQDEGKTSTTLEALNRATIAAVLRDVSLRRTVEAVLGLAVSYTYVETDQDGLYFQMAVIDITAAISGTAE